MIMINPDQPANLPRRVDLRRRPHLGLSEWMLSVATHFHPEDRILLEAIFREGATVGTVAALRGVSRYTISRRVRQLTRRATDERFVWAAGCLTEWPALRAEVARACILRGIPLRDAATQLMVSQHTVRNELAVINALFRESQGVDA